MTESVQIRRLFRVVNGGTPTSDPAHWGGDVTWITPADLGAASEARIDESQRTLTKEGLRTSSTLVPPGSLIVSTRAPIGHLAIVGVPLAFNQGCRGLVPLRPLDERFFYYQLLAKRNELQAMGQGSTFPELSGSTLASIRVLVPPLDEQRRTADFLERIEAQNRELTCRLSQQITLHEERRDALITAAVNGQFDPSTYNGSAVPA